MIHMQREVNTDDNVKYDTEKWTEKKQVELTGESRRQFPTFRQWDKDSWPLVHQSHVTTTHIYNYTSTYSLTWVTSLPNKVWPIGNVGQMVSVTIFENVNCFYN